MSFQILQFGLDRFQVLAFWCLGHGQIHLGLDQIVPRTWSNSADLKSSPVLIVGFEILHQTFSPQFLAKVGGGGHISHFIFFNTRFLNIFLLICPLFMYIYLKIGNLFHLHCLYWRGWWSILSFQTVKLLKRFILIPIPYRT
jgi:hypothetical protein